MTETTKRRDGSRTVQLSVPFQFGPKEISELTFRPVEWGDYLDWREGRITHTNALLARLVGLTEDCLRFVRFPDMSEVLATFMAHIPEEIRVDIAQGTVPMSLPEPGKIDVSPAAMTEADQNEALIQGRGREYGPASEGAHPASLQRHDPDDPFAGDPLLGKPTDT